MANYNGWQGNFLPSVAATIANGNQESTVIHCLGLSLVGIALPAAFTGTALTFEACDTVDGTFLPVYDTLSGTALSYTVAQGHFVAIDPAPFQGVAFLKIKSGSAEAADRALIVSLKGI
jgi:hypothetical protein